MTRVIYRVLFRNYADQNDLFNRKPNDGQLSSSLTARNLQFYDSSNKYQPALFYDFFLLNQYTVDQARTALVGKIKEAWVIMNNRQADQLFQNQLNVDIYSIIPYGPINNGSIVYRVIYAMAIASSDRSLDASDYSDPDDYIYSITIPSVVNSSNYSQYLTSAVTLDRVDGVISIEIKSFKPNKNILIIFIFQFRLLGG
jgi:hypothetical protein